MRLRKKAEMGGFGEASDELRRNELLDRVRRREREATDLFVDILQAPASKLPEIEGLVRRLEGAER